MYPCTIIDYRLKASRLKVVHPLHDFSEDKIPLEFEIFCRNTLIGITKNSVLDFEALLQDMYRREKCIYEKKGAEFMDPPSYGQILLAAVNNTPLVIKGEKSDPALPIWHTLDVHRTNKNDWRVSPVIWKKDETIKGGFWSEISTQEPIKVAFEFA